MENKEKKENEPKNHTEDLILNLPVSTSNISFGSQRTNKGWLVYAMDRNGVVTALTFVPD